MKHGKISHLITIAWSLILTLGILVQGCSDSTTAPSEMNQLKNNLQEPWDIEISQFLTEWWNTLFDAPFNTGTSNAYMEVDVTHPGVYQGTTDSGEIFTVDAETVDYFDQNALLAISSEWQDEVDDYDMRISFLSCTISTSKGQTIVGAFVSSGNDAGSEFHLLKPIDYIKLQDSVHLSNSMSKVLQEGWVRYYSDFPVGSDNDKTADCSASCQENSPRPTVHAVVCPAGQTLNSACESDCKSDFEDASTTSLGDACEDLCDAYDDYEDALEQCEEDLLEDWGLGFLNVLSGPISTLINDASTIKRLRRCWKRAGNSYDSAKEDVQKDYDRAVKRNRKAYRNCALDCCEGDEPEHHEIRDLIPW